MPFDATTPAAFPALQPGAPPLLLLAMAGEDRFPPPGAAAQEEAEALRGLGRPVLRLLLATEAARLDLPDGPLPPSLAPIRPPARQSAARRALGEARAARLALAQGALPARLVLRLGRQVAAIAHRHGCDAIHATSADSAALVALAAGRLAGCAVSRAGDG
ncbi:hypothetical protein HEQ75_01510, partial [Roseomonas sp. BU-1]|nr:hypothetical protein [Falsiroseomonas selenitidurans]